MNASLTAVTGLCTCRPHDRNAPDYDKPQGPGGARGTAGARGWAYSVAEPCGWRTPDSISRRRSRTSSAVHWCSSRSAPSKPSR